MAIEWVGGWASARVRALHTVRSGAGVSLPPHDRFNLGSRCGDDPAAVAANRAELVRLAGLPGTPRWLRQVHGVGVLRVDAEGAASVMGAAEPEADAAVTSESGVVLAVLTADCLPVVLAAGDGSEVAVAHAGWRGLAGGVLEATVAAMRTPAGRLQAWLGPAAGPQAYEVGEEVRAAFLALAARDGGRARASFDTSGRTGWEGEAAFVASRAGHWWCDLYALARWRLAAAGVGNVRGGGRCTISEPQAFFSHRRDGVSGRMATLAWLQRL